MIKSTDVLGGVPQEVADSVLGMTDFPISLEETKAQRLKLMRERKHFVVEYNEEYKRNNIFGLCEH